MQSWEARERKKCGTLLPVSFSLHSKQSRIGAIEREQLRMGAQLGHGPVLQHGYAISNAHSAETVTDQPFRDLRLGQGD